MDAPVLTRVVTINDPAGMHMRPADAFARAARGFKCQVWLVKNGNRVDGGSILDIMTLAVTCGSDVTIECCGEDAEAALDTLAEVIQRVPPPVDQENGAGPGSS